MGKSTYSYYATRVRPEELKRYKKYVAMQYLTPEYMQSTLERTFYTILEEAWNRHKGLKAKDEDFKIEKPIGEHPTSEPIVTIKDNTHVIREEVAEGETLSKTELSVV